MHYKYTKILQATEATVQFAAAMTLYPAVFIHGNKCYIRLSY